MSNAAVAVSDAHPEHPRNLIPELCRNFYRLGWATGTGGGISIRLGDKYYVAPSGVQKERIEPDDVFILDAQQQVTAEPANLACKALKVSECTPLFFNAYTLRGAGACLHTHSQNVVLISLICGSEFRISHQEMLKGIPNGRPAGADGKKHNLGFRDTLVIPIIENTDREINLEERMAECIKANPTATAVIVRRHGMYVWGDTWQKAKGAAECIDYLMELALRMRQMGLEWEPKPETVPQ
uniref:Probable methylthioribulose-1-phosphate dehydratase n=1 Tax=Herpetomonas muscarum TaxID=5718 RepID=U5KL72_HERMU|nr:methylthioribulose 1-phosphate dehydratase [Herpetomonas muscarum]